MIKALLVGWESKWVKESGNKELRRGVPCLAVSVVIGFGGGLRGEEFFLTTLEEMLKFWECSRQRRDKSHVMITLKVRFKE